MEYYSSENKAPLRWGLIAVAIYLLVLVALMFTIRFTTRVVEPVPEGILVEFGQDEDGLGEEELVATDVVATPPTPQPAPVEESLEVDEREEIEVEQPEVVSAVTPEVPQTVQEQVQERDTVVVEERTVNQLALFPGRKEQSAATSQGASQGAGNQGAESGSESGAAVGGGDDGTEFTFELRDRSLVGRLPKPDYGGEAVGRVVIDITVDETGRVKSAAYRAQGSTTNNSLLVEAAQKAALEARFTPSENFIQGGTITYIFKMD